jgi:hypothetical protein
MTRTRQASGKIAEWRANPVQYVVDNFQVSPDAWQIDVLRSVAQSPHFGLVDNERRRLRLAMKACTGPGKSAVLSWIGWHRLSCFGGIGEHPKGAALSVTKDNLKDNLWTEFAKWQSRSEFLKSAFTWTKEQIYANDHPETWFLSARSFAKDADADAIGRALSGLHSRFPFVLLDETGDMPVAVGRAAEQIFTGDPEDALIAQAGNPTSVNGLLYHSCSTARNAWNIVTITADPDDPNRTPRVDIALAREQIETYGRDNPWVMATILGLFPPAGFNNLVSIDDMEQAMARFYKEEQYLHAPLILGVDVARQGDDSSVIAPRQGLVCFPPKVFRNVKSHVLAGYVAAEEDTLRADGVIIDGTGGWGAGVLDAGTQMNRDHWLDCQYAGKAFNPKYANKRAENSFLFAEWIKNKGALPNIPQLIREATAITYTFQGDRLILEPKEIIKKRLGHSTDYWDSYSNTFAFPIERKIKGEIPDWQQQILKEHDPYANRGRTHNSSVPEYDPYN